jgi:hypothetical protein
MTFLRAPGRAEWLAHTALQLRRFENREMRRLAALQPEGPPTALIAVVIPTFRRPLGLQRAVASVLGQTISDLVAIVVDDGGGLPPLFVGRRCRSLRFSRLRRNPELLPKEDREMIFRYSRRHRVERVPESTVDYLVNPDSYWTAWRTG